MIAAIVAANLLGLIGLLFAAPVMATLLLFGRYAIRKMVDLDPWPNEEESEAPLAFPGIQYLRRLRDWARDKYQSKKKDANNESE